MPKSSTETTQEFGSIVSIPETREVLYGAPHLSDLIPDVASSRRRLNNYRSPFSERGLLLLGGDILAALCATFLAYTIWHIIVRQSLVFETGTLLSKLYWFPAVILLWMAFAWVNDMYDATRASTGRNLAQQIIAIWGSSLGIGILAYYLLPDYAPRTFVLLFLPTMAALVGLWRTGFAYFGPKLSNLHRVLMIGEPHAVAEMAAVAHQSQSTYHVAAWASVPDLAQFHFDSNGVGFLDLVRSASIREVVVLPCLAWV
ncbi:MAG: hypothetical protein R3C53_13465 [Pirellulaceae bacterium]